MAKRSISDEEIALIKAMLFCRGMKNRDIQFYFNRPDRPVNSGRITQIRGGTYGPTIAQASEADLASFLSKGPPSSHPGPSDAVAEPRPLTNQERARLLFESRGRSGWFLKTHENENTECKENFALKPEHKFADPLRSIAGLANNEGGFVFFGVKELPDGSLSVVGMSDDVFSKADPADINRCLAGALDPVPVFSAFQIELDGKSIGVIHIEKHEHPPIVATKNVNNEFKEGAIYFRYVGETRVIKPGELHRIIAYREQKAVAEFARRMSRIAVGATATLDLDSGKVEGKSANFLIDEDLLPKIQFLRHGEFKEESGAPALRLIGEVSPVTTAGTRTVRTNVTDEAMLLNYLKSERVAAPLAYVLHSASTAKSWLPLFYYANASGLSLDELVTVLDRERPSRRRAEAIQRLSGTRSAFQKPSGKSLFRREEALAGSLKAPLTLSEVAPIAFGIQALLDNATVDFGWLKTVLLNAFAVTSGNTSQHQSTRSLVYRAACRLDELEFRKSFLNPTELPAVRIAFPLNNDP
jgi:hypothetical protein